MSSIIAIDIPDSCAECPLSWLMEGPVGKYTRYCPLLHHYVDKYNDTRSPGCRFKTQLPKKHGDLIDRTEVHNRLLQNLDNGSLCLWAANRVVSDTPTIVDEER